jgi:hypothetical protein
MSPPSNDVLPADASARVMREARMQALLSIKLTAQDEALTGDRGGDADPTVLSQHMHAHTLSCRHARRSSIAVARKSGPRVVMVVRIK